MINNRKVRLMTKLAIYEKGEGKEDLKLSKFFRRDYLRDRMLRSFVSVTIGFVFLVGLGVLYNMEYIVSNAVNLDYMMIMQRLIAIYIVILAIYVMASLVFGMIHYNRSRNKLARYFRMLRRMRSFYYEEETGRAGREVKKHVK
ncbi:MAG: hypothetical protein K6F63_09115 [Lachnospiraceae bacterium]|nr:hypothetical protein [Lachnospiraceae bacterium]